MKINGPIICRCTRYRTWSWSFQWNIEIQIVDENSSPIGITVSSLGMAWEHHSKPSVKKIPRSKTNKHRQS